MTFDRLKRRLYLLSFIDEFGPVYAVYTLWFNDNGISTSQISTMFLVWAIVALALEIPSGALADRVDRRHLLATAFGIRAGGLTLWMLWPTFTGALIGTAMWATHDALASGAWEAMIHDELTAVEQAPRYQTVMARIGQFSHVGVAAGTLLGAALLQVDVGLQTLGWITVAAHAGSTSLVATLPNVRSVAHSSVAPEATQRTDRSIGAGPVAEQILDDVESDDASSYREWWATLRAGVRVTRQNAMLARLVVVGAMLEGLFILDEYLPLLARARGGDDWAAPIIVFVVWVGLLIGGEVAARMPTLSGRTLGLTLIAAVGVTTAAFLIDSVWTLMLVAVGYAALELVWINADARLQERAPAATRATVTSVRGFGSAAISMVAFAVIGAMADGDDPTPGHFPVLIALGIAGVLIVRWLPRPARVD